MYRLEPRVWRSYHSAVAIRPSSLLPLGLMAWRHGLNSVVYVPSDLHGIREMLALGRISEAISELWRRADLGSDAAAALLEYFSLRGINLGDIDKAAVRDRCRRAAARGDGFAQYVLAWRQYHDGDYSQALQWINRAVERRFVPAIADVGRFAADGVGMSRKRPDTAVIYLRHAIRQGHLPSIMYLLNYGRRGAFGAWWRIPAAVVTPLVLLLMMPVSYLRPFHISVFAHPSRNDRPPFVGGEERGTW